ncbi:MAG: hypothetical protein KAU50_12630 [Candidatus Marinimicrobia bacterium]|nr:hypothetical protein [Candidatus Neomarinimicrobiota bacterium]
MGSLTPIQDIKDKLNTFERELPAPSERSIKMFIGSHWDLWSIIRSGQNAQINEARRLRKTYVRRFLEVVPELPAFHEVHWFDVRVCFRLMSDDLEELLAEHPQLEENYEQFINTYSEDDFNRRLEQLINDLRAS